MLSIVLDRFEKVSLNTLNERSRLPDREDIKYVFPVGQLQQVLHDCVESYDLLHIDKNAIFKYRTWYYDTADLQFYHQHHAGKSNRCKIRKRLYVNSGLSYIEVKHKTNKGRTVKYRQELDTPEAERLFIQQYGGYDSARLQETIEINYNRITLLHKTKPEKVTLDINLSYRLHEREIDYNNMVVAEIKTAHGASLSFRNTMKQNGIRQGSLSKYCLGLISLNRQIKYNNFKQVYHKILKINQHGIIYQP